MTSIKQLAFYVLVVISLAYLLFPNARLDFTDYNSHDAESYLALSKSLIEGRGYTRSLSPDYFIPHTLWPPGIPILFMPALLVSGATVNLYAVKYTVILLSILGLWISRAYAYRLSTSINVANFVALALALNPIYWHFSRIALAEMPVYVWFICSLLAVDLLFRGRRPSLSTIAIFGVCVGLGMLLKGILLGLALAPLPYLVGRYGVSGAAALRQFVWGLAFCVPFAIWMAGNLNVDRTQLRLDGVNQIQMITKKTIEDPLSESKSLSEILMTAERNLTWYAIYNLPRHLLPAGTIISLRNIPSGRWIALAASLFMLGLVGFRWRVYGSALLCFGAAAVLVVPMTIGGSERYWFSLALMLFVPLHVIIAGKIHTTSRGGFFALVFLCVQAYSLLAFVSAHLKMPYTQIDHRDELASVFEDLNPRCKEGGLLDGALIFTPNPHALALSTSCNSSMVNETIGVDPAFTHAIVPKSVLGEMGSSEALFVYEHFVVITLNPERRGSDLQRRISHRP